MAKQDEADPTGTCTPAPDCRIVAIGSSAGGLAALKMLFDRLPADLGVAFVVITHLDPDHPSDLVPILSRRTRMPVAEVADAVTIEPDHVYVVAPNRQLVVANAEIATMPFEEPRGQRSPIDRFFRSLAEHHRDGFAIVLSGSGSDGTAGIRAMKGAGGIILAQAPEEAEYASMPRSAIATGCVDVVAPVVELATLLAELVRSSDSAGDAIAGDEAGDTIRRILAHLRSQTGHDFSTYKMPTIQRRIQRRMQINHLDRIGDYLVRLRDNADEVHEAIPHPSASLLADGCGDDSHVVEAPRSARGCLCRSRVGIPHGSR